MTAALSSIIFSSVQSSPFLATLLVLFPGCEELVVLLSCPVCTCWQPLCPPLLNLPSAQARYLFLPPRICNSLATCFSAPMLYLQRAYLCSNPSRLLCPLTGPPCVLEHTPALPSTVTCSPISISQLQAFPGSTAIRISFPPLIAILAC